MALAALVVAWGSSFAMTKIAVASVDPAWVMALRLSVAGIFLGVVVMLTKRQWPRDGKLWLWFAGLGFIGHAVPFPRSQSTSRGSALAMVSARSMTCSAEEQKA